MSRELAGATILILTVALLSLCGLEPSHAQMPGFISIDCGASRNYTDSRTGIEWVTDEGYINTGSNVKATTSLRDVDSLEALKTSRCFPSSDSGSRKKNCYTLPVARNSTFLVRASFYHGMGPLPKSVRFSGSIDYTFWVDVTISATTKAKVVTAESIFLAENEQTSICFLDIGEGTPCVSALELRPLGNAYRTELQQANYLALVRRWSFGTPNSYNGLVTIRYPLDEYDRDWQGTYFDPSSSSDTLFNHPRINTTLAPSTREMTAMHVDNPPKAVMQSALEDLEIDFVADTGVFLSETRTFVLKMYVWDFVPYKSNDTKSVREFDTYWLKGNKEKFLLRTTLSSSNNVNISSVQVANITSTQITRFSLRTTNGSQRQAMINGAEIFAQMPLQQPTYPNDVNTLFILRKGLGLSPLWTGDPCSPTPWDWISCNMDSSPVRVTSIALLNVKLSGGISPNIGNLTELTDLWLTDTNLSGTIPNELGSLKNLRTLHLNNNKLTGSVPVSLAGLPELVELYIYNNDLSGTLPQELLKQSKLQIKAYGNPKLQCTGPCDTVHSRNSKSNVGQIIAAGSASAVLVLGAIGAFVYFYLRSRQRMYRQPDLVEENKLPSPDVPHRAVASSGARTFNLSEIKAATQDFYAEIAKGGFGPVYYGKLADGQEVAVKVHSSSGHQGAKEFFMEVDLLSRIHHKNLVSLVGFCQDSQEQILVYPYMRKGTVRDHLYGGTRRIILDWGTRLEIALDSARGLAYLHTGCKPPIIHRDVKSSNILLDDRLTAKVADFGISRVISENSTGVNTVVAGTLGYLDPEYFKTQRLTHKSDVYGFGVVLLEIVTGQPPNSTERHIQETVRNHVEDNDIKAIVDPALEGDYYIEAMWKVIDLAMECVNSSPAARPDILNVVRGLEEATELERSARTYQQPYTTRRDHSSGSSAGPRGNRNPSELLNVDVTFRRYSASSKDFVTDLIPR